MNNRQSNRNNQTELELNSKGYSDAHRLIKAAQTQAQLLKAVEMTMKIIKDCKLDYVQQEQLEQLGLKRYENIMHETNQIIKNRKF